MCLLGAWPVDFQGIDLRGGSKPEDFTGIVRREIAAAIILKPLSHLAARFPDNARADGVTVAGDALQLNSQPVVAVSRVIFQEHGRPTVDANDHVHCAVIVVIAHRESTRGKILLKDRACLQRSHRAACGPPPGETRAVVLCTSLAWNKNRSCRQDGRWLA